MNCAGIEVCVAEYFSPRVNLIVPNVSWGLLPHEADVLVVTPASYAYEIEIKVSKSDLKADLNKSHGHRSNIIRKLYFAIPETLVDYTDWIPVRAGILVIREYPTMPPCKCIRDAETNENARKLTDAQRYQVARLGTMRIWKLKHRVLGLVNILNAKTKKEKETV